jgi:AcrR family transcriptional regulator
MERKKGQEVRVEDIARAAGVSRQAVYLHFGSRAELLIATVRYVDEKNKIDDRLEVIRAAANSLGILDAYIEFWGNYIPEIYGLAKALIAERETDLAAAAAWDDRMKVLREGCRSVIQCLARDRLLAPGWDSGKAADMMWAMMSIAIWENLTRECGWSTSEYISRMQIVLRQTFVKSG